MVCGAAIVVDGRILLLQRLTPPESGCRGRPGGKVDLDETAGDATRREVGEETGLVTAPEDLPCLVDQIDRSGATHRVAPVFLVAAAEGIPRIMEPQRHADLRWFALDALPPCHPLTTPTRVALEALRRRAR